MLLSDTTPTEVLRHPRESHVKEQPATEVRRLRKRGCLLSLSVRGEEGEGDRRQGPGNSVFGSSLSMPGSQAAPPPERHWADPGLSPSSLVIFLSGPREVQYQEMLAEGSVCTD